MGLLGKMVKNAVNEGVSSAVGKAVEKTVAPAAENFLNKAAEHLNITAENMESAETAQAPKESPLSDAISNFEKAAQNYGNAAVSQMWQQVLYEFPRWSFCPIKDMQSDEGGRISHFPDICRCYRSYD